MAPFQTSPPTSVETNEEPIEAVVATFTEHHVGHDGGDGADGVCVWCVGAENER